MPGMYALNLGHHLLLVMYWFHVEHVAGVCIGLLRHGLDINVSIPFR
jgi:hypothetical protein